MEFFCLVLLTIFICQPHSQGSFSPSREKVLWLRMVTCVCKQINFTLRLGPRLNFVNSKIQVYLENYLKRTKYEIATISFCDLQDKLSAKERDTLTRVFANTKVNIKKADKGNTTVVIDTHGKITEGNDLGCHTKFYTPLQEPVATSTAYLVNLLVKTLYVNKHIEEATFKWLYNS